MTRTLRTAVALLAVSGLSGLLAPAAAQTRVGEAVVVVGNASASQRGSAPARLAAGDDLLGGTRVSTGVESFLKMTFGTRGAAELKPASSVVLTDAVVDEAGRGETLFELVTGKMRLTLTPDSSAKVQTTSASIGVLGTDVRFAVDERGATLVAVYEGVVTVTATAGGPPLILEAGYMTVVEPGRQPTQPASIDPAGGWFPPFPNDPDGPALVDPENLPIDRSPRS